MHSVCYSQDTQQSFTDKVNQWYRRHEVHKRQHQMQREEQEQKEIEGCTFHPTINSKSEVYAKRSRGCFGEPLVSRLHHEAANRATLRNKAKELLEVDEVVSCTFRPQINRNYPSGKTAPRTPIHLRAKELQQAKVERVREAQGGPNADCPFQPKISQKSERLVQRRRDGMYKALSQGDGQGAKPLCCVEDRLYADAQHVLEQRRAAAENSVGGDDLSRGPSVDGESRRICESSVYFQGPQRDFLTRQQTFELARQRRMEVRAAHAEAECPFRPQISEASRQMVSSNVELIGESRDERLHRLAVKDVEERGRRKEALEGYVNQGCTFQPQLNRNSVAIAVSKAEESADGEVLMAQGSAGIHERLYRSALNRSRCGESQQQDEEEHSFHPQLDPRSAQRYSHVKSRYGSKGAAVMDQIKQDMSKKAEAIAERRRAQEEELQAACTFAPSTRKSYQDPQKPVVVSGLGRFFELRELAQQKQREQQDREAKVFRPEIIRPKGVGVTIPEPFALSSSQRETMTTPKRRQSCGGPPPSDYSFTPTTNESAAREAVRRILGQSPTPCRA